jgi:hypothetical protein
VGDYVSAWETVGPCGTSSASSLGRTVRAIKLVTGLLTGRFGLLLNGAVCQLAVFMLATFFFFLPFRRSEAPLL